MTSRQNRVTPTGEIVAHPARGSLMGNRGCLHAADGRIVRSHRGRRWIACVLSFKGRRRPLLRPGRYTELFFLDEPTALAAGHRPCAECRRADYDRFRDAWARAFGGRPGSEAMDRVLHDARIDPATGGQARHEAVGAALPDGAMALIDGAPHLAWHGTAWRWTPSGYDSPRALPAASVPVLTPAPVVAILAAGYLPDCHASVALIPQVGTSTREPHT
jgi:hypothetical protein